MPESAYHPGDLAAYFDHYGQREWQRLVATPVDEISLYLHSYYLRKHIQPGFRVLEIGAGAGRFTQLLTSLGTTVIVADISHIQLELNRINAAKSGFQAAIEGWIQADICELPILNDASVDCAVVYGGPFSYVLDHRDAALSECLRVLNPGGLLLLSVMSLWGSCHRFLDGVIKSTPVSANQRITASGDISPDTFPGRQENFMHLFRSDELKGWLDGAGLHVIDLSASGCLGVTWDPLLQEIRNDPEKWGELLRMELEASATPGSLDMGTHLIAVCRK